MEQAPERQLLISRVLDQIQRSWLYLVMAAAVFVAWLAFGLPGAAVVTCTLVFLIVIRILGVRGIGAVVLAALPTALFFFFLWLLK